MGSGLRDSFGIVAINKLFVAINKLFVVINKLFVVINKLFVVELWREMGSGLRDSL